MTAIPTLRTERLTLRPHRMSDFAPYAEILASDRARYIGGPVSARDAWSNFCRDTAQWSLLGHGAFAIDVTATQTFIGQISIAHHPYFPELEIGWTMAPSGEGKGFAFEAAARAKSWILENLAPQSLVSYIHAENARSIALAERLGATRDPDAAPPPYAHHLVWRHPIGAAP